MKIHQDSSISHRPRRGCGWALITTLSLLVAGVESSLAAVGGEIPIEYLPQQVAIAIGFADRPELLPDDRVQIRRDIQGTIRRLIGARWHVTILDDRLGGSSGESLARLAVVDLAIDRLPASESMPDPYPSTAAPDKLFVIAIEPSGTGFEVHGREWDRLTDSLGGVATEFATSRSDIARAVVEVIVSTYRPVAIITDHDETPRLTFHGAALPTPDPGLLAPTKGTLFRAQFRRHDRDGTLVEVQPIPYTYLVLNKLNGAIGTVTSHSALRSAFGSRRGAITAWAIAAPPVADSTDLTLLREADSVPLAGRRIEVRAEPFQPGEEPAEPIRELLTDRSGTATLTRNPEHPLVWVTIQSGRATLMRLPIAPGSDPEIVLSLGNDQRRLEAEGRLAILTGELIETVAKRATLLAKARRSARNGKFGSARGILDDAEQLPTAEEFHRRLAAIRAPAATAAEEAGQRMAAARIRAFAGKTGDLIDRYLGTEPLQTAKEEIEELEKAVRD